MADHCENPASHTVSGFLLTVEALTAMAFFIMTPFCSCQFTGQEHASLFLIRNEGRAEFRRNGIQNVADF
jgi:hypothetical protein